MAEVKNRVFRLPEKQNLIILIVFAALIIGFRIGSPYYLTGTNITSMLVAAVPLGLIAIGECVCLMSGYFDMSVGMVASLAGIVWAKLIVDAGVNTWLALFLALGFGLLSGALAGVSVAFLSIPAWMATYALFQIWRGIIYILTNGTAIRMIDYTEFKVIGQTKLFGSETFTLPILILLLAYLLTFLMLRYTKLGRSMYIIGGNMEAARNAGIKIKRTQVVCFLISGVLAALGGLIFASRSASAQPFIGELYAMQGIAATVVGGTKMTGGKANIAMTLVGVLIIIGIQNGLNMIGVPNFYQFIATGSILFIAVLIQTDRRN